MIHQNFILSEFYVVRYVKWAYNQFAITLQAEQLYYNNCDVIILMHKRNAKKRSWYSYGTPGAGAHFLTTHGEINELWTENILNFEGNAVAITIEFLILYAVGEGSHSVTNGMCMVMFAYRSILVVHYFMQQL